MSKIDLYVAHSLDRGASCPQLAQALTAQLEMLDQYDTVNRGRVETARAIIGDPQRRGFYDSLLSHPDSHVDEQVLASIATGAPSAPSRRTASPGPVSTQQAPHVSQQYAPVQPNPVQPAPGQPNPVQPAPVHHNQSAPPPGPLPLTRVVVVPDGFLPTAEYWADNWSVEVSADGTSLRLVGTGKGAKARKAAKNSGGNDRFAYVLGAAIGIS